MHDYNYYCLLGPACIQLFLFSGSFPVLCSMYRHSQTSLSTADLERPSPGSQLLVLLAMCSRACNFETLNEPVVL